jgi:hypothetical protein
MFAWLNKQGVQCDRGFAVQFTGRFSAEYREGTNMVTLDIESGMSEGKPCIILDANAFARWDNGNAIPQERRKEILDNFRQAMEFQGLSLVVE